MKFKLKDVLPNPYRDFKLCPLIPAKVDALVESIETTEFWDNIVGRKTDDGKLQIAYGHHRLESLNRKYKPTDEFDFIVRKLSDAMMLQMMARENSETYGSDLSNVIESVKATVAALATGQIKPEDMPVDPKTREDYIRYAPSYITGKPSVSKLETHPYTVLSVATFLGATKQNGKEAESKIVAALRVLELEEMKVWDAKVVHTFRKDGSIPVDTVLRATKEKKTQAEVMRIREAEKAEAAKRAGESLQKQVDRAAKEEKAREEELKRLAEQRLAATKKEDEEKAERIKQEMIAASQARKDAEAKRKQAQKEWDANQKAREQSADALRKAKEAAAVKAEAARASFIKTAIDDCDRRATNEDPMFERLKDIGRDKRTTEVERKLLINAIEEMSERVLQLRVFVRPELGKVLGKKK